MPMEKDLNLKQTELNIDEELLKKYKILDQKCDEILNRIKKKRKNL